MERPDEAGAGERDRPASLPPRPPAEAAAYLHHLSSLAGHSFPLTSELLAAVLKTVVDSLGLRTSYLTHITCEDGRSEVLAAYNAPGGCDVAPGTVLVLTDTF